MMTILLFLGMALASDPIERPSISKPVDGECYKVLPINKGKALPQVILDTPGVAKCSAVAVPLSQFSDLLQTEQWGVAVQSQYKIETSMLQMEIDWYKKKLVESNQPVPWLEKPATQRWLGRIETIVVVGIVTAGLGTTYYYTSGVGK
tara:strand:+ start:481 stop:924 length:444 start_codon:yes stop_codon:yes gene_type:complete